MYTYTCTYAYNLRKDVWSPIHYKTIRMQTKPKYIPRDLTSKRSEVVRI